MYATHASFGTYHAGVVCNDVDTNYELEKLPQSHQDLLSLFKVPLLKKWDVREKEDSDPKLS